MTQVTEDSVAETSTTTGTGDMVLAGAITAHRTFSSVAADGTIIPYRIEAVDGSGNPTGSWETGIGVYNTGANSITRQKVDASSNANALVNFAAGTKRISLVLLSSQLYKDDGVPLKKLETLSPGFDPTVVWYFNSTVESWTVTNGTIGFDTANGKGILVTDTSAVGGTLITSPAGLTINGNLYRRVKASITLVTLPAPLGSPILPRLLYVTGGHSFSESFRKVVAWPVPFSSAGDTIVIDFDMETADNAPDWYAPPNNTITQFRLHLTDAAPTGTVLRINWVAVGANRPVEKQTASGLNYPQVLSAVMGQS